MSDLRELYQELILDHTKAPRNFRAMDNASHQAKGHNPLCGDKLDVFILLNGDRIEDVSFEGSGCAISTASASLMTEMLKGCTREEAEALFETFHHMLTEGSPLPEGAPEMGKLEVFEGVREFPVRVKCATLAWHTVHAALEKEGTVTTE